MFRFSVCSLLTAVSSFALAASPALAETETEEQAMRQETVVVLGARQAYRGDFDTLEIPQADQLIGEDVLRNAGAIDLTQALDLSASVARQNNFGGLWNSFAVRGFIGDQNLPSNYLVNGFNAGRGFGGPRDLSGVESVEVLKGPRAALFGRGEPGGTVNLVTKRPTFETAGQARASAASFDTWRVDGDWTAPLSDMAAIRLVGFYEDAGSFRDTVETLKYGATPSVALRLTDRTLLTYELEYSRQEIPFDRGVVAVEGELGRIPESRFLGEPGDGPLEADVLGHQLELQHDLSDDWSVMLGANWRDTALEGFSTEPELTAARQRLLVDGETLTRQRRYRSYDANYYVVRGEVSGRVTTGPVSHRLLMGVDTDRFENDQVFGRARAPVLSSNPTLAQLQAINIFNPVYGQYPLPVPGPLTDRVETQEATGVFIQDQIALTDRLEVRVGLRYDDYSQTLENRLSNSISTQSFSRTSPQFGIVYSASDAISLYAVYGENFRPLSGSDFAGNPFDPNKSKSIEGGIKFLLAGEDLVGTVSVFQIEQDNILVSDPANAGFSIAGGEAESKGLEIDLQGRLTQTLSVWMSYAYVDASLQNDVLDPDFALPVEAGSRLLNVPEHAFSLQVTQEAELAGRPLNFGGGLVYVGERLGEIGTNFELPDYTLLRAFAAYDLTPSLTLRAEVDNLTDETWYANSYSQLWVQPGTPRSFRVSAAYRF
ncbi:TonB-dependent receptor for ferrichrome transport [Hyphomonas polymorpha PS728]|uniref:TonB-dependent receptor for ferrichrome transport n=1 Tax=Hyphomonas polymorpha PS728 TaxID=1280954 RepID=A0A062VHS5_9PROT|nr:TonB-dependent siderophore receptor [Hyphomonas polymorpha]KCZ99078.1 TonB-dependent receptor for ferrichrome transport [Hyphomonas polymorpha PS728]